MDKTKNLLLSLIFVLLSVGIVPVVESTQFGPSVQYITNSIQEWSYGQVDSQHLLTIFKAWINDESMTTFVIFISPQYGGDEEIINSLEDYALAIKNGLNWNTQIIKLDSLTNKMDWIDREIEEIYDSENLIAAMIVGEDTKIPLHTELHGNQESPLVATWADTDGEIIQYTCKSCSCCKDYTPEVAISLLIPNSELPYATKKSQIISTFNKFSQQKKDYGNDVNIFMSEEFSTGPGNKGFTFAPYGKLYLQGNLNIKINPNSLDIANSLSNPWKIYAAEGHATPYTTITADDYIDQFYATNLEDLNTALYLSNGCFTSGWFADSSLNSNNILDPPITSEWYGNYVLTNPHLRTEFNGGQGPDFTYCASEMIAQGKTMAKIFIKCDRNTAGVVMFGDPSLRFKPFTQAPSPAIEIWSSDLTADNPRINQDTTIHIKIRNVGNLDTIADVIVYDSTDQPDLIGSGHKIYHSRLDGRSDLEICRKENLNINKNNFASFNCVWKPTTLLNNIVIVASNKGPTELNEFDNGNNMYIVAS